MGIIDYLRELLGLVKRPPAKSPSPSPVQSFSDPIGEAFRVHGGALIVSTERRTAILTVWKDVIDKGARDYLDLVLSHDKRQEILKVQGEMLMDAYFCGYMASRGWIAEAEAKQAALRLSHALRDDLQKMGIALESLDPAIGRVIDEAMTAVVELGLVSTQPTSGPTREPSA